MPKADNLAFCVLQLKDLIRLAKDLDRPLLAYLLELALAEAMDDGRR